MAAGYQGLDNPGDSRGNWSWGLVGSVTVHALIVAAVLVAFHERPKKTRIVVPVKTINLVPYRPGPHGGGGSPGPVTCQKPAPPKPAPAPAPKPRIKPRPRPRPKPKPKPVRSLPEPTKAPVIPTPAPAPAITRTPPGPSTTTARHGRGSGATAGLRGTGRGGRGGGRGGGSGSGVGRGTGRGTGSGSALQGYLHTVRQLLERQKKYPWMARRRGLQGVVVMRFTIAAGGQILSFRVSRASGHNLLDQAARDTIRRVGKFPPFPTELNRQKLTIEIPLAYRLRTD